MLLERSNKCIEVKRDYIKKNYESQVLLGVRSESEFVFSLNQTESSSYTEWITIDGNKFTKSNCLKPRMDNEWSYFLVLIGRNKIFFYTT